MANSRKRTDGYKVKKEVVAEEERPLYNTNRKPVVVSVKLQNMINAKVKLPGPVTGKLYIWERAGAVVEVDEEDAAGFLAKTLGEQGCCGGKPYNIFQFVE
jgi:hypothetical protein